MINPARQTRPALVPAADGMPTPVEPAAAASPAQPGWRAELELGFGRRSGRTVLTRRRHEGPLLVQRPFYPEGPAVAHCYVLHPPGGIVGGDSLDVRISVDAGAHGLITMPAATKSYASKGAVADLTNTLHVAPGAWLEWLPAETIAFDGTRFRQETAVHLHGDAGFMGWDILCLGRPAAGETFTQGWVRQGLSILVDGALALRERGLMEGGGTLLRDRCGWGGWPVSALLVARWPDAGVLELVREALGPCGDAGLRAVTHVHGFVVVRFLGREAMAGRQCLERAWASLRPVLRGLPAEPPGAWRT